jgi:hypothetical protein
MESRLHCSLASVFDEKENDNDAKGSLRDCLAESETTSTSATLGADQPGFRCGSLSGSGICLYLHRVVLDDYVELGIRPGWSSRLVLPLDGVEKTIVQRGKMSCFSKRWFVGL